MEIRSFVHIGFRLLVFLALWPAFAPAQTVTNPHGDLRESCQSCHTTAGWDKLREPLLFVHDSTRFPLQARHAQVACIACHTTPVFAAADVQCLSCHQDIHHGQFGNRCEECHSPASWTNHLQMVDRHKQTPFPLLGAHARIDCQACHAAGQFAGLSGECVSCHLTDFKATTEPDHMAAGFPTQCTACHRADAESWAGVQFAHTTRFPLTGGHAGRSCTACHANASYTGASSACYSCHNTDFERSQNPNHVSGGFSHNCEICHTIDQWRPATFDHDASRFPLTGAHRQANCLQCHANGEYTGTPSDCWTCHQAQYMAATENLNHAQNRLPHTCEQCHTTVDWHSPTFVHEHFGFPLTGRHAVTQCAQCHLDGRFAGTPTDCWSCHQGNYTATSAPDHEAAQISQACAECHTTNGWTPSTFSHGATNFPLTGAHIAVNCQQCHIGGQFAGTATDCWSCHQTDYNGTSAPDHEAALMSQNCTECHTTAHWAPATFDHGATDFPLTGAHVQASCQQCHVGGQFAGTPAACLDCHEQNFQGTDDPDHEDAGFATACQTCHTTSDWHTSYDHSQTGFPLTGAHISARCNTCHTGGPFANTSAECWACHQADYQGALEPAHAAGQLPHNCEQCHTTTAWTPSNFNHGATDFPLTGAHVQTSCQQCHTGGNFGSLPTDCWSCHQTDYNGTSAPDHEAALMSHACNECHTTTGWTPSTFSHSATNFPLTGAHIATSCQQCHIDGRFAGTPTDCWSCHQTDYNGTSAPDHEAALMSHACNECHTTTGWTPSTFSHNATNFPLTGAHVQTSCQQCHIGGQFAGTPTDCWSCHEANYRATVDPDHEAAQISQQCSQCHSTNGWTPGLFDHSGTDFPLTGAHMQTSCQQCHINGRFVGTPTDCWSCHEANYRATVNPDHEAAQISQQCSQCHSTNGWTPGLFDHSGTDFPLTGAHVQLNCQQCHVNGQFQGTPTACIGCHQQDFDDSDDPDHANAGFPETCLSCHSTQNWQTTYDHSQTGFPLVGAHASARCAACHTGGPFAETSAECWSCHQADYQAAQNPNHADGQLPHDCAQCHNSNAWTPSTFSHGATEFPLTGAHIQVSCQQCHVGGQFANTPTDCWSCHEANYRATEAPDHEAAQMSNQCTECHTTGGWVPSTFSHAATGFPLTGAHVQAACQQCHIGGQFEGTATDCWSCHQTDYNEATAPDHATAQLPHACNECHTTARWSPSEFSHSITAFPLTGAHVQVSCQQCHVGGQFAGTPTTCWACHEAQYRGTNDPDHEAAQLPQTCNVCHSTNDWTPGLFDHSGTDFPLTGAHLAANCQQCHINGMFQGTPTACAGCHQANYDRSDDPNHANAGFGTTCQTCHTTTTWESAYDHSQTGFPLVGAHSATRCNACHVSGPYSETQSDCWSCHQADYQSANAPNHTAGMLPHDCSQCHNSVAWTPSTFSHNATAFPLTGAHIQVNCQQCHTGGQFAGTPTDCWSCHEATYNATDAPDHAAGQLPHQCLQCHTTTSWTPATFQHVTTGFPLTGAHISATCQQCHTGGRFENTPSDCWSCHQADYAGTTAPDHEAAQIPQQCNLCHNTTAWIPGMFDHSSTAFPLTGAHVQASCQQCHTGGQFAGTPTDCWSCHSVDFNATTAPDHEAGQLPHQCSQCHTTLGWVPSTFNHSATAFPLTGAHITATCQQCHTNGQFDGTPTQCLSCHAPDYESSTDPNHLRAGFSSQCQSCHTTGNWHAAYNHEQTGFPLVGAHVGVRCMECHTSGPYGDQSAACWSCHEADYHAANSPDHDAGQFPHDCAQCHNATAWTPSTFNHSATAFPLTGAHIQINCQQCHTNGQFDGTPTDCWSCHQADYRASDSPDHEAGLLPHGCQECHTTTQWVPATFDHAGTAFPLTGAHRSASCQQCHANGQFEGTPVACLSCHAVDYNGSDNPDHAAAGFSTQCQACHTTQNWHATYNHSNTDFPLTGAHISVSCIECHASGQYNGLSTDCWSCHQADFHNANNPDHDAAQFPHACLTCHTTTNWNSNFNHSNTDFPLTGAHVSATCVQCHASGQYNGLPTACVSCHQADYNGTTDPNHAAAGFSTQCQTCHTTTNWNSNFNHSNTDFPLTGAHVSASCISCHASGQYNGLPTDCWSCHQADYHATVNPDHDLANFPHACLTCHTTQNWNSNFNHANTDFPLTGAHVSATCVQCHASGQYNGLPTACVSCHQADYNGTTDPNHAAAGFSTQCQTCHTTTNWNSNFNHANTDFPLTGAHVSATCVQCHASGQYNGLPTACVSCHQSDYNGTTDPNHAAAGFSTQCQTCHTTTNWNSNFNHANTDFPLTGAHVSATCVQCHASGQYNGLPTDCWSCHQADYHATVNPDHDLANFPHACLTCHTTQNWNSNFNHANTDFPLTGAHINASCVQCHASGQYNGLPTACVSCHQADYNGTTDPNHAAAGFSTQCQTCHTTTNWNSNFNHANTDFPLTGAHVSASCVQCHASGQYNGLPTACVSCHQADYNGTTDPNHAAAGFSTQCQTCHTTTNWNANFNHSNTDFPLTGAHINASCVQCHASGQYNGLPTNCWSCHSSDFNGATDPPHAADGFPHNCEMCHTTSNWNSNFNHDGMYFPIYSGSHRNEWNTCSECHTNGGNFAVFSCIGCHEHRQSSMDSHHSGVRNYVYESNACYSCHPNGRH